MSSPGTAATSIPGRTGADQADTLMLIEKPVAAMGLWATAVLLMVTGAVQFLQGVSAVQDGEVVVGQYIYRWSATGWGIVHIVLGVLMIAAAWYVGRVQARVTAIALAAVSIVMNFLWLPYNPWWSVLIIALDAFLVWALATWHHGPDIPADSA
jgi:hypothetical protein